MPDIYDKTKRSALMSQIRSSGNRATELKMIAIYRRFSISGWRRKQALPGRPDFVFWRERVAVFVDGCFWHGCPIHGKTPSTNVKFWAAKLSGNVSRDSQVSQTLRKEG
jgi:DNA mismatch endonuclease (patch repair protein)